MSEHCPHEDAHEGVATEVRGGICDRFLVALVVLALFRAGEALAADSAAIDAPKPDLKVHPSSNVSETSLARPMFTKPPYTSALLSEPLLASPGTYGIPQVAEPPYYSKEFRPRGRSVYDVDTRLNPEDSLAFDKTIWERLQEYRNRDRIRVLTLWESGASAVSIQTNRKGDPSLQWTSRLMNRGGATHGLLDHLFPVSVFNNGGSSHVTRSATSQGGRTGVLNALHVGGAAPP